MISNRGADTPSVAATGDIQSLSNFLSAQYDDDERLIDEYDRHMSKAAARAGSYVLALPPGWQPGEPFDVDRQRADLDTKRRILARHSGDHHCPEPADPDWTVIESGQQVRRTYPCGDLRDLAAPYADRPGYPYEWRRQ